MSASSFLSFYMFILLAVHCLETGFGFSLGNEEDVKIRCIERERQALLMIKQELIDEYGHLSSWRNEEHNKDCCKWRGVSCSNRTGHVVSLNLNFKVRPPYWFDFVNYIPLKGNISASLLELLHLNYLNLSSNDFGGQRIPEFIASLNKLRHLDLSSANFSGRVPYQLGNLSNLQTLDLSNYYNMYAEKLEWLSHLFSLRHLDLSRVNLREATDWLQVLSGLPSLAKLELRYCDLPSVTASSISFVNSSKSLAFLDLSGSNLTHSMYSWLYHYSSSLIYLHLSYNNLQGPLPDYIFSNMTSLVDLDLTRNQIEGNIPRSFRNLCRLKTLRLNSNNLTGQLPAELFQNSSSCIGDTLEVLSLGNNTLSGSLPDFTGFSSLKQLTIGENELNGTISKSIGQLFKHEFLDVHSNSLEGMITETHLSNLSRLIALDISRNVLSLNFSLDWIPPFQLVFIQFAGCKIGPHFPNWLQTQNTFSVVDISQSGIVDIVPDWFWDLSPNLYHLNLSHNRLSGMLPDLSLKLTGEPSIDLNSNCFEGSMPAMPPNLRSLFLSKNKFSGSISFLCGINGTLSYLDLSDNQLPGEMPDCFGDWPYLYLVNLANNNFSGQVPKRLGVDNCSIEVLDLNNNSLVGELPSSLKNCSVLKFLNLGNNKLSGTIPTWISDSLSSLIVLSLQSNQFRGKLPIQLCNMEKVQILDFSHNNISGTIPKCLNNLTAMVNRSSSVSITIAGDWGMFGESKNRTFFINFRRIYLAHINLVWKEITREFGNILGLVKSIDLSNNKLVGGIPEEITILLGLISLNLSSNNLSGPIPPKIGQLNWLNSLDLSKNMLSGKVPDSFSQLDSLVYLNLSNNNLSGKIPLSTKLQSFDASSYMGNTELCGPPLSNKCVENEPAQGLEIQCPENTMCDNEKGAFTQGFYVSVALGFFTGFWGVCGTLMLKKSWRYAYFQFLKDMKDKLYVFIAVNSAKSHGR